jgi:hypothetical protein
VTSQLDHPGVVPVHELGLDQRGKVYFTMRLVKGRTASEVFAMARAEKEGWTTTRALEVVLKVCDTMAYAHDKGVLHRDLKPSNVMVGRFGEVYVMDWGLAKVLGQADRHDLRIRGREHGRVADRLGAKRDEESDARVVGGVDGRAAARHAELHAAGAGAQRGRSTARRRVRDRGDDVRAADRAGAVHGPGRAEAGVSHPRTTSSTGRRSASRNCRRACRRSWWRSSSKAMAPRARAALPNTLELAADVRAFLAQRVVKAYRTGALVEMKLWVRATARWREFAGGGGADPGGGHRRHVDVLARSERARQVRGQRRRAAARRTHDWPTNAPRTSLRSRQGSREEPDLRGRGEAGGGEAAGGGAVSGVPGEGAGDGGLAAGLRGAVGGAVAGVGGGVGEGAGAGEAGDGGAAQGGAEQHARWPELQRLQHELTEENDPAARDALKEQIATLQNEIEVAGLEFGRQGRVPASHADAAW